MRVNKKKLKNTRINIIYFLILIYMETPKVAFWKSVTSLDRRHNIPDTKFTNGRR